MTRFTFLYSIVVTFSMDLVGDDFFKKKHFSFCILIFSKCTTFSRVYTLIVAYLKRPLRELRTHYEVVVVHYLNLAQVGY